MRTRLVLMAAVALVAAGLFVAVPAAAAAPTIEVTTTDDLWFTSTNDCSGAVGKTCSLRWAIALASAKAATEPHLIHLPGGTAASPRVYLITLTCSSGNDDTCYDLNVYGHQPITIRGDGAATTVVDGNQLDRVFHISGTATLEQLTVRGGATGGTHQDAGDSGGGVLVDGSSTLSLANSVVSGNAAAGNGGGVEVSPDAVLNARSTAFTGNTALYGGAIDMGVVPQQPADRPRVPAANTQELHLTDVSVTGNSATQPLGSGSAGGGILVNTLATLTRVTMSDNHLPNGGFGGALYAESGQTTIVNSTITGNSAPHAASQGGGLAMDNGADVPTLNTTIEGNSSVRGANVEVGAGSTFDAKNTIVANPKGGGSNCDVSQGAINTRMYNLEFPGTSCGFTGTGDIRGQDPRLGPLRANGGPTQTEALDAGSPAIDAVAAANCPPPSTDQTGTARPQNGKCDIGAFEVLAAAVAPASVAPVLPKAGTRVSAAGSPLWALVALVLVVLAPLTLLLRRLS